MADRTEFLDRIRHRTRSGRYQPTRAPDVAWTPEGSPREREPMEDPSSRFLEELEAVGGRGKKVASAGEVRDYLLSLAEERNAKLLVRWDVEELEELGLDGPLEESGAEVVLWRDLDDGREVAASADIGITTAEWAIAETGSLVLAGGPGMGRSVTLLPPVHVAVVPVDRVLRTVPEAIERYSGSVPANLCFHTGPSRTGDIEMTLSIGVHGPGEVHVVLLDGPDAR
ncbi:MAG: lactate utilization protein [Rubrobacteraceae bacterium]